MRRLLSVTANAPARRVAARATILDSELELNPSVALRPEPFGALAYNYGNRRLVFLRHPDLVKVATTVGRHETLRSALVACEIDPQRWPSFTAAFESLKSAEVVRER